MQKQNVVMCVNKYFALMLKKIMTSFSKHQIEMDDAQRTKQVRNYPM